LIVPVVRSLFDKVASLPDPALLALDLELDGLAEGEIADLSHIQQAHAHGSNQACLLLNLHQMAILAKTTQSGTRQTGCTHRGTQGKAARTTWRMQNYEVMMMMWEEFIIQWID
jgi:hypothetical protein